MGNINRFNDEEITILQKYLAKGYKYAAKDRLGDCSVFESPPLRNGIIWDSDGKGAWKDMTPYESDQMIHLNWEDEYIIIDHCITNNNK